MPSLAVIIPRPIEPIIRVPDIVAGRAHIEILRETVLLRHPLRRTAYRFNGEPGIVCASRSDVRACGSVGAGGDDVGFSAELLDRLDGVRVLFLTHFLVGHG